MGRRGPKPKPSEAQKRAGTYRPDRRKGEVSPEKETPPVPSWLSASAKKAWHHIAPWLEANDLLTRLDQVALALLCESLADYLLLREMVKETGWVSTTDKGAEYQHPAVGSMNKAWERVVKMLREFGMTPSARAGLSIAANKQEADPMTRLLQDIAAQRSRPVESN